MTDRSRELVPFYLCHSLLFIYFTYVSASPPPHSPSQPTHPLFFFTSHPYLSSSSIRSNLSPSLCNTCYPHHPSSSSYLPRIAASIFHTSHPYHPHLPHTSRTFTFTFIYPLTAGVVGAPQMTSHPVSSCFPCSHCPLGLGEFQVCPFPDVVFPPLPLSALSSSPFHCALQGGFGQT